MEMSEVKFEIKSLFNGLNPDYPGYSLFLAEDAEKKSMSSRIFIYAARQFAAGDIVSNNNLEPLPHTISNRQVYVLTDTPKPKH